jgi:hypothetical protein
MENLWRVQDSGVDLEDFADYAEYKQFLKRFNDEEERTNRRQLLFGENNGKSSGSTRKEVR